MDIVKQDDINDTQNNTKNQEVQTIALAGLDRGHKIPLPTRSYKVQGKYLQQFVLKYQQKKINLVGVCTVICHLAFFSYYLSGLCCTFTLCAEICSTL
jgi:hypothetical protein